MIQVIAARNSTKNFLEAAKSHISTIQKHNRHMQENGAQDDKPSGLTPRKRSWNYADSWNRTESREQILDRHRSGKLNDGITTRSHTKSTQENLDDRPLLSERDVEMDTRSSFESERVSVAPDCEASYSAPKKLSTDGLEVLKMPQSSRILSEKPTNLINTRSRRIKWGRRDSCRLGNYSFL